jgi:quercetin dioxygenase-like cupin family protein
MVLTALAATGILSTPIAGADGSTLPADDGIKEQLVRDLAGVRGKEVRLITIDYPPGGESPAHRHNAQVFVYVLEGSMRMQVKGSAAVTLHAGQTFYEGPHDVHLVSANASQTTSARILVLIVKDKGQPLFSAPTIGSRR